MHYTIRQGEEQFKPVTLELIFESQDEIDAWHGIFQHRAIADAVRAAGLPLDIIRDPVQGYADDNHTPFSKVRDSLYQWSQGD